VAPAIAFACKVAAVAVALALNRIIIAFHSAVRGAGLVVAGVTSLLVRGDKSETKMVADLLTEGSSAHTAAIVMLVGVGVYTQLSSGFAAPFPLNILLMPLTIAETACQVTLAWFV
jgi:hypothetical protein